MMSGKDRQACERRGQRAGKIAGIVFGIGLLAGAVVLAAGAGSAHAGDADGQAVLQKARSYRFAFRTGKTDIVPEFISTMEQATQARPDDPDLWYSLGDAYLSKAAVAIMPGGDVKDAPEAI